jgi:D-glycero-alpha-D-manno-heptose-7-phosphate kinase
MMVITKTPFRMSLFGGGTDYPEHFQQYGGCTLSTAINKYGYIIVSDLQQFLDYKIRVTYSKIELVDHVDDLEHPAVRECLKFMGITENIEIHYTADLPARSGLGSSSCFTVGLLKALHAYLGDDVPALTIAEEAVQVEREWIGERVGLQDQYSCAIGGLLHLSYAPDMSIRVYTIPISLNRQEALRSHVMLFYTGLQRNAHDILEEQIRETKRGELTDRLQILGSKVPLAIDLILSEENIQEIGEMLHDSWEVKRTLSSVVSNSLIDSYYDQARLAGSIGGKLMGAGGGGFLLLFVAPENQPRVRKALSTLREVTFQFEPEGTRIIYSER